LETFELIRSEEITELNTTAKIYRHRATGAEVLSMVNSDENKCFGISFRTPPSDSTGVAHILEHTVLCGSRKYPVKDPFVQMLKGSLQTYLNAFTYPDKTCYPVASQNLKDFYNLVDVYLDAVFFPRITRDFFMQEGWQYELDSLEAPLTYKGVVYNEMKGVYSSPDSLLMESSQQSLYPDTTYGLDSGGNPKHIPELTYEQFTAFHKSFYHPSNARIFFYGNDPEEARLEILEAYLSEFQPIDPRSEIPLQPAFEEPVRVVKSFAVSADDEDPAPMFTVNWLLPSPTDAETHYALSLLDHILLGTPASPLRKALIESGLGEDITGGGMESHMIQMMYSVGLKEVDEEDLAEAEALIFNTLKKLAKKGINKEDIEGALNTFEFDLRENNSGGFPRGLSLMLKSLNSWIYDADPLSLVAFEAPLQAVKQKIAADDRFFEKMIETHFINNRHRSTVTLLPDTELAARIEQEEKERLAAAKAAMSEAELKQIMADTQRLLKLQATQDAEEDIAKIPLLKRSDLEPAIKNVDRTVHSIEGTTVLTHALPTNGILYLDIGMDLQGLNQEELCYASLLGNMLLEMGTTDQDYVELSQRIASKTGGIYGAPMLAATKTDEPVARFFLRSKCMLAQSSELFSILRDILLQPNFDQKERFRQMAREHKSEMETAIVPRGHSAVMTRLKARHHLAHWTSELMGGVEALFFSRKLLKEIKNDWPGVVKKLEAIHAALLDRHQLLVNITVDETAIPATLQSLETFLKTIPATGSFKKQPWTPGTLPDAEALTAPSQVNYVGCAANLYSAGYKLHGSALVITRYLQTAWLWEKIRVQGGAYGGMCSFDQRSGVFTFASYRDPNLASSIQTYLETGHFLKNLTLSEDELTRSLIGAIGQLDSYQLPDAKGYSDCMRYLLNYTPEERQKLRDEVLATTQADFNAFGEVLLKAFEQHDITVLCSPEAMKTAIEQGIKITTATKVL
jgi:presequence protease